MNTLTETQTPQAEQTALAGINHRIALTIVCLAPILGIAGDYLLFQQRALGLQFSICMVALIATVAWLQRLRPVLSWHIDMRALGLAGLFAAAFAWRDSTALGWLNAVAIMGLLLQAAWMPQGMHIGVHAWLSVSKGWAAITGMLFGVLSLVFRDVQWRWIGGGTTISAAKPSLAVLRGLAMATPVLVVFGLLFMGADERFAQAIATVMHISDEPLVSGERLFVIGVLTWLVAGLLWGALFGSGFVNRPELMATSDESEHEQATGLRIGSTEVSVVLGSVIALFGFFLWFQLDYLFGGLIAMQAKQLSFSAYARQGFGELLFVSALSLPLLMKLHTWMRLEPGEHSRVFNILATWLVTMLSMVMYSAWLRIDLYTQEYGLTTARLLAQVALFWLALVFTAYVAAIWYDRRTLLERSLLPSVLIVLGALNLANPEAIVVRDHVERIGSSPHALDSAYLTSLSADAVPEALAALPMLADEHQRCDLRQRLILNWSNRNDRGWSWSRWRATVGVRQLEESGRGRCAGLADLG